MAAFSVSPVRSPSRTRVGERKRHHLDGRFRYEEIESRESIGASSTFNDDAGLEHRYGGAAPNAAREDRFDEYGLLGLAEQNGDERGGIDHHLLRQPQGVVAENVVRAASIELRKSGAFIGNSEQIRTEPVRRNPSRALETFSKRSDDRLR